MLGTQLKQKIVPRDYDIFAGLDVDKMKIPYDARHLLNYVRRHFRGGELKSIHVPSVLYRDLRHLVQLRDTFVRQAVAFKLRIKALLLIEGLPFPSAPAGSRWSSRVLFQLKEFSCRPSIRFKLDRLLEALSHAQQHVRSTTCEMRRFCQSDAELTRCLELIQSIPGIGAIVATHLLARIGDWRLIRNSRQISGLLGVVPCEDSN